MTLHSYTTAAVALIITAAILGFFILRLRQFKNKLRDHDEIYWLKKLAEAVRENRRTKMSSSLTYRS